MKILVCEKCEEWLIPQFWDKACPKCRNKPPFMTMEVGFDLWRRCCVCGELSGLPANINISKEECYYCRSVGSLLLPEHK